MSVWSRPATEIPDRAAVAQGGPPRAPGVQRGDRLGGLRASPLPKVGPEGSVVGLDLMAARARRRRATNRTSTHVELVTDDLGEAFDRCALAARRRRQPPPASGWRILIFALPRAPRPRRTISPAHGHSQLRAAPLEGSDRLGSGEIAEMHARELAIEVLVDLIRDERTERREHPGDREQAGRRVGRPRGRRPRSGGASGAHTSWKARRRAPRSPFPPTSRRRPPGARYDSAVPAVRERAQRSSSLCGAGLAPCPVSCRLAVVRVEGVEEVGGPELLEEQPYCPPRWSPRRTGSRPRAAWR